MKKNIIAFAVAAALVAPAAAMADTTLYGKFHVSYDFVGGDNHAATTGGFSSNSSRIGIKGKEKINDSLSIIYQYETGIDAGQNASTGASAGGLGGQRNTFIGATGAFGTVITGRHDTPMKMMGRKYDLFGDTVADSRNIIGTTGFDLRPSQVLAYATPDLAGFKAMVAYINSWAANDSYYTNPPSAKTAPYYNNSNAWSMNASYSIAGFGLDAAYETRRHGGPNAAGVSRSTDAYRLGANYKIAGFKIMGLYMDAKNVGFTSGKDLKTYGVGAAYSFGANTIKAQYYKADSFSGTTNTGGDLWAVGYDYKLSKQTSVYAVYGQTSNDTNGTYTIMGGGHDYSFPVGTASSSGLKTSSVSLGIQHKF
ncbi:porin [Halothiobacillus diazotrophicus]|nr:porin [Halothiobacillus diazotrophicus]